MTPTVAFGDSRLPERFWRKVEPGRGQCWLWIAATSVKGYGRFAFNGHNRLAHRVAYEVLVAPIPQWLQIDHLCRVRACVNPRHLEPVTPQVNTQRSPLLGLGNLRKTHCPAGHPYDASNTYEYAGARECRRTQVRKYKQRKRSA